MNYDTTPMNPTSYSMAFYNNLPEKGSLRDIFRAYGLICFRNGFAAGFATGTAAALLGVVVARKLI